MDLAIKSKKHLITIKQKEMKNNIELTLDFLGSLKIDNLDILDFINKSDINSDLTFDDLTDILENNNAFDVEIIYYTNAIEYLSENDNSLHRSLNLAAELCYGPGDLSSEILASLLASYTLRNDWSDLEADITDFLNSLEW